MLARQNGLARASASVISSAVKARACRCYSDAKADVESSEYRSSGSLAGPNSRDTSSEAESSAAAQRADALSNAFASSSPKSRDPPPRRPRLSILSQLDPAASWLPPTSPARPRRNPTKRSRMSRSSQTPQEAENFNRILNSIFEDLNRNTDVRIGTSKTDPWANTSMYGSKPRAGGLGNKYTPYSVSLPPYFRTSKLYERVEKDDDEAAILEMDEMQEEASIIQTDIELVEWAKKRVFTPKVAEDGTVTFSSAYSRILGYLMRVIRTHYSNPHLALAVFHYAQLLSLESYLSGCLAPAYNELIKIRWESFRDLEGVELAVREMEANAVVWDATTHKTINNIVDEIGKEVISGRGEEIWGSDIYERVHRLESKVQKDLHKEELIFAAKQREARLAFGRRRRGEEQDLGIA